MHRIFAIGDIHGCAKTLDFLLTSEIKLKKKDHLVFLGDYIDRNVESCKVIDILIKLKKDYPGLRLSQLKEMLQKMWKKSPDNPMNASAVAYNSTVEEVRQVSKKAIEKDLERMKISQ